MEANQLILYSFFNRLRKELGIELDMQQYFAFLKSLNSGIEVKSPEELLDLCKIHWLTRPQYRREFERYFFEEFSKLVHFNRVEKEPIEGQKVPKNATEELPPRDETPNASPPTSSPSPEGQKPLSQPTKDEQFNAIYVNFKEGLGLGGPLEGEHSHPSFLDNDFIFSDKYLPTSDRKMKQNWRYLKGRVARAPGEEMDILATVEAIARTGFLLEPIALPMKLYRYHILFLIDHGGSMSAFEALSEHLVNTIRESLRAGVTTSLYFHNYPGARLFWDTFHTKSIGLEELLNQMPRHSTLIFIISDGGAARGSYHGRRIEETRIFLAKIRDRIPHVLWLNPMPNDRWERSSAEYISYFVDMLEASGRGFRKLPEKLKHL